MGYREKRKEEIYKINREVGRGINKTRVKQMIDKEK